MKRSGSEWPVKVGCSHRSPDLRAVLNVAVLGYELEDSDKYLRMGCQKLFRCNFLQVLFDSFTPAF